MRLLLVSDVHLDTPFTWAGPDLARVRRLALRSALQRAVAVAGERGAEAFLIAGDLYENERFAPDTADFLRSTFASLDMPVIIAPGNHDWFGPGSIYQQVTWPANVHIFSEDRLRPLELADGLTLWGAAHRAPANTDGFLDHFTVDRGGVNLALFHGSEHGDLRWQESAKKPHAPFRAEQVPQAGLVHAFVGHFHQPKDGEWHTYPGNPDPLAFGETGVRGAVLIDVSESGSLTRERIPVAVSHVSDVRIDITGVTNSTDARAAVASALPGLSGVVRATIYGEVGVDMDLRERDLADLGAHLEGFLPRFGELTAAYDLDVIAEEATVRGEFVRDVRAATELDEDARRRVLLTGLRALEGRTDLEVR